MIKVVSFNILCGGQDENIIPNRAPRLKEVLAKYDPDLVGFQEATPVWMPYLEEYYGEEYEIFNQPRKESNPESTPMMWRKSRFECLKKGFFWFSDIPDAEYGKTWDTWGCNRICMWAILKDKETGETIHFFNTHYGFGDENQLKSGELIMKHIDGMGADRVILTADFNMYPTSPGYKQITARLKDVNVENDPHNTFHGFRSVEGACRIDFCFVSPDTFVPHNYKVINDLVDGKFPSDHFGVYTELESKEFLRLVSFNVKCSGHEPINRARMLRKILRDYKADLVGLQEVTPPFEEILNRTEEYGMFLMYRGENNKEGTPILWRKDRFDVVHQEYFWLSETPDVESKGFGAQYLRIANLMVLQFKGNNRKICLLNSHYEGGETGVKQVEFVKAKLAPYFGEMPVFLTGDFNMMSNAAGYKKMIEDYKDVRFEVAPSDGTPTTNGFDVQTDPPRIIDYVFTNGVGCTPKSYKVMTERPKGQFISDHYGLFTTFVIE